MRPDLTRQLSAQDFRDYYWLKEELLAFCRAQGLSTLGSKAALTATGSPAFWRPGSAA